MRTVIAGSRGCEDPRHLREALQLCGWRPTVVLSGAARGADRLGEVWAAKTGTPVEKYPAEWDTLGKQAGYIRNAQMAASAEALIALWDGESRGTKHMINLARAKGLRVYVHLLDGVLW